MQLRWHTVPAEMEEIVYVKRIYYNEPIERLYYSTKFDDITIYLAGHRYK